MPGHDRWSGRNAAPAKVATGAAAVAVVFMVVFSGVAVVADWIGAAKAATA